MLERVDVDLDSNLYVRESLLLMCFPVTQKFAQFGELAQVPQTDTIIERVLEKTTVLEKEKRIF